MKILLNAFLTLTLVASRAEGQVVVAGSAGVVVARDSAVARLVAVALFEHLADISASAAFDTTARAVTLTFPEAEAPEAWRQLHAHLMQTMRGRERRPGDQTELYAIVGEARVSGNTMTVRLSIGIGYGCRKGKAPWTATEQWYLITATRDDSSSWSAPTVTWAGESLGVPCEPFGGPNERSGA